ncbi:MAG: helix-hairpin-helix domain-containing protein [Thiotrichaceae bacterium]|nr:helix-hairpin-helix domain-containing protein [Thiotrichaceae bacterium]
MRLLKFLFFTLSFMSCMVYAESASQVNVNKAAAVQLQETLSGIGEKKAQAIVDYRNAHGEFNSVYDLTLVNGIGKKTVEKNLDRILLTDPEPATEETSEDNQTEESSADDTSSDTSMKMPSQIVDIEPNFSSEVKITTESLNAAQKAGKQVIYSAIK